MAKELWQKSAVELGEAYGKDECTPVDVLDAVLRRIERVNPVINAFVTLDLSGARQSAEASAKRWQARRAYGPLDGVPISVKDNIPVKGVRSTWGSRLYENFVPDIDELPIARLRSRGAIVLGKTNCPEFTLQGYTDNLLFGPTRNPWDSALTPGGSSGGAVAAVAAGLGPIAIATDGGGSIRRPASHTGLVGLKPSRGRVPRCDGFPAIILDFESVGPIARTVDDLVVVMRAFSDYDVRDPLSLVFKDKPFSAEPVGQIRIRYIPNFAGSPVDREIAKSVADAVAAFSEQGHIVEEGRRRRGNALRARATESSLGNHRPDRLGLVTGIISGVAGQNRSSLGGDGKKWREADRVRICRGFGHRKRLAKNSGDLL